MDQLPRLGKRELICLLLFTCNYVVSIRCFGVRVSVMFHFMFVRYTFKSVCVDEWPPFW